MSDWAPPPYMYFFQTLNYQTMNIYFTPVNVFSFPNFEMSDYEYG